MLLNNGLNNMQLSNVSDQQVELIKLFLEQFENIQVTSPDKKTLMFKKINEKMEPKTKQINEINSEIVIKDNEQTQDTIFGGNTEQQIAKYIESNEDNLFILTLQLQYLPEGTAEMLEAAFKPRMPECTFKTMPNGDLSIKCSKDKLEAVKMTIAIVKVNSFALEFTEKTLK
ncbi:Hypothetical_protein [Hexamita inflata]|uniref:Hypothetical_protein n=1 Tax=Hexamita inflata TaxID=28002 RepID=A0AA86N7Q1_9EUKA|nr:Hypothetical protein HINF_LOCUS2184 [Hexamita inflata]